MEEAKGGRDSVIEAANENSIVSEPSKLNSWRVSDGFHLRGGV